MAGPQCPQTGTVSSPAPGQVRILPEAVAMKIAAGEVIDRPYAALRELLDNAIDAGSTEITVHMEGGGIRLLQVQDNGSGMERSDLDICWLPHATSKIAALGDLERVSTLGFRGEALSSLAACSRLEILSGRNDQYFRLSVHGGGLKELKAHPGAPGTTVTVKELFFNMPARRNFLKSTRAEGGLCRRVFLEKAAAHPRIAFRLFADGVLKSYFPGQSPARRIAAAWPRLAPGQPWWETAAEGEGFSILTVHQRPEIFRRDRQYIHIYANRRRIDEFSLVQAVEYACDAWMPGGHFPVAFVFIEIHPSLVDFNIHPAKKEARFRDIQALRHQLIESLKDRLAAESYKTRAAGTAAPAGTAAQQELEMEPSPESGTSAAGTAHASARPSSGTRSARSTRSGPGARFQPDIARFRETQAADAGGVFARAVSRIHKEKQALGTGSTSSEHAPSERAPSGHTARQNAATAFRYLGQIMGVFLLAERGNTLYIVDQHAAHERVLFDRYRKAPPKSEKLLFPRPLELDRQALMRLELRQERLAALGVEVEQSETGQWQISAVPEVARGLEEAVAEFIESGSESAEELEKELWADVACKAAVKDNSVLDPHGAEQLLSDTFALGFPRCPHGRPLWFEISRAELFELVGRTV